ILGGVDSGGQNVYVGQVARHLAALGYEVDVFTRRDAPDLPDVVEWVPGARIVHITAGPAEFVRKEDLFPHMDAFTLGILRFAYEQELRYDLFHANFWMSGLVALNLKEVTGVPFVVTFHALGRVRRLHQKEADQFPDERFQVEDRVVAAADAIVAECPQDREDLVTLYHADPSRLVVIPAGIDPDEFEPVDRVVARKKLGLDPDAWIVLQLGRMVPRKGVANVIRGFARLVQANRSGTHASSRNGSRAGAPHPPLQLLIVGGESSDPDPEVTPEIGRLQAVAAEEGVQDCVVFVGRRGRDELRYYYSAANVFVTTPWYEPFGITPLEAMASARPVVGSRVGGIQYTVRDGETGYLVPPRDPVALARRLQRLLESPKLVQRFGEQALERAHTFFTWETVARSLAATYQDIIAGSVPASDILWPIDSSELAIVDGGFRGALDAIREAWPDVRSSVTGLAALLSETFAAGGKVLICGNGGSAADAQHLAAELVGRFVLPGRRALPAMALGTDPAVLTAWANDFAYEDVFGRQVEALGRPGDLLLGLSTSGRSLNVIRAFETARDRGMSCAALLGRDGGDLLALADEAVVVPSTSTQRIQEIHTLTLHLICELVEAGLVAGAEPEFGVEPASNGERPYSTLLAAKPDKKEVFRG
ncbi:MAG TPA: glycosyltransferase, partial [Anaerolineae bacterium]|nr:glycosyltransferase [Anaerolineae bacterium]